MSKNVTYLSIAGIMIAAPAAAEIVATTKLEDILGSLKTEILMSPVSDFGSGFIETGSLVDAYVMVQDSSGYIARTPASGVLSRLQMPVSRNIPSGPSNFNVSGSFDGLLFQKDGQISVVPHNQAYGLLGQMSGYPVTMPYTGGSSGLQYTPGGIVVQTYSGHLQLASPGSVFGLNGSTGSVNTNYSGEGIVVQKSGSLWLLSPASLGGIATGTSIWSVLASGNSGIGFYATSGLISRLYSPFSNYPRTSGEYAQSYPGFVYQDGGGLAWTVSGSRLLSFLAPAAEASAIASGSVDKIIVARSDASGGVRSMSIADARVLLNVPDAVDGSTIVSELSSAITRTGTISLEALSTFHLNDGTSSDGVMVMRSGSMYAVPVGSIGWYTDSLIGYVTGAGFKNYSVAAQYTGSLSAADGYVVFHSGSFYSRPSNMAEGLGSINYASGSIYASDGIVMEHSGSLYKVSVSGGLSLMPNLVMSGSVSSGSFSGYIIVQKSGYLSAINAPGFLSTVPGLVSDSAVAYSPLSSTTGEGLLVRQSGYIRTLGSHSSYATGRMDGLYGVNSSGSQGFWSTSGLLSRLYQPFLDVDTSQMSYSGGIVFQSGSGSAYSATGTRLLGILAPAAEASAIESGSVDKIIVARSDASGGIRSVTTQVAGTLLAPYVPGSAISGYPTASLSDFTGTVYIPVMHEGKIYGITAAEFYTLIQTGNTGN